MVQWSHQGVFLLNAVLTVRAHTPASHSKQGWETFTDAAIATLSAKRRGLVFLLWGRFAQQKSALIDRKKHHILTAAHPSGFSANKVGCRAGGCELHDVQAGLQVLRGGKCIAEHH